MLEVSGYNIVGTATNGEYAIKLYHSLKPKPQIILMDYRLPNMSGIDTSIEILKIDKSAKIIFLTADTDIKQKALEIGVSCVITKPFLFDELAESIKKTLKNDLSS